MNTVKPVTSEQHLQSARPAEVQHPAHQLRSQRSPPRVPNCSRWRRCSGSATYTTALIHRLTHRRPRRPGHAPLRKAVVAEDPAIIEHEIQQRGRRVDDHHDPRLPAAAVKRGARLGDQHRRPADAQNLKVLHFVARRPRARARPARKTAARAGSRPAAAAPKPERDPHRLPHHQPDPLRLPRAVVLGHERVRVRSRCPAASTAPQTRRSTPKTPPPSPCRIPN